MHGGMRAEVPAKALQEKIGLTLSRSFSAPGARFGARGGIAVFSH